MAFAVTTPGTVVPYQPHAVFTLPDNLDTIIWRYLSVAKFLAMLEDRALWFASLQSLPDPFEGVPADAIVEEERAFHEALRTLWIDRGVDAKTALKLTPRPGTGLLRMYASVNCWHMNDYESMAMWQDYGKEGIAIRSTLGRLITSLQEVKEPVFIGNVIYRDRRNSATAEPLDNTLHPAIRKGMSYDHERELRAVVTSAPSPGTAAEFPPGVNVGPVNLDALIGDIYVAPQAPTWFKTLVKKILKRYTLEREPVTSDLDDRPDLT